MKSRKNRIIVLGIAALLTLSFTSCKKESTNTPAGKQQVSIYLKDDPSFNFTKVLIDVRYVEVKVDSAHHDDEYYNSDNNEDDDHQGEDHFGKWDTLNITAGIYDLLHLRNGIDTLLASGLVPEGKISKIRITLGTNNTAWTDDTHSYPLNICDNEHYIYAKVNDEDEDHPSANNVSIHLDFNLFDSIEEHNGIFCLQPELEAYSESNTGSVEGEVLPMEAHTIVTIYNSVDTAHAMPGHEGEFKIEGLKEGTYSVLYDGVAPYIDTTLNNINVAKGQETKLPHILLHQ